MAISTIEKIILRRVAIKLHEPFRISNGEVSLKESIIIELHGGGVIGYGEASPMSGSFYSTESPDSTLEALSNDLAPQLLASQESDPLRYAESLNSYPREPFARAGIEGAMWHFAALKMNTSIAALFGLRLGKTPSGLALGLYDSIEQLVERATTYLSDGYQRLKIKIMPGWDIEPLEAIRKRFGNIPLMVDANASYDVALHRVALLQLDRFGLMMIEQPLAKDALKESAELQRLLRTPICVDESAETLEKVQHIIDTQAAKIVNIKVQRVGGLLNARKMHDMVLGAGLPAWLGTMPELGVASAQALQLGGLPGFRYPSDIEASSRWFKDDLLSPQITMDSHGVITPPNGIGMGYEVDRVKLEKFTTEVREFVR